MADEPVHYEVFTRQTVQADWRLEHACEERTAAIQLAEEALQQKRAVGVKVTKESRQASGSYASIMIFSRGDLDPPRRRGRGDEEAPAPLCVSPADLYSLHARERIARLFEGWLARHRVTAFELLHRPDLAERLEASGVEIQHAIQKVAVPEAQSRGVSTHEVIRRFQRLADGAVARLRGDARCGAFPDLERDGLEKSLRRVGEGGDGAYVLGVAIACDLGRAQAWTGKVERILDLAEACRERPGRALVFHVLQQPLSEIVGGRAMLAEMLHGAADLGRNLALLVRLVAPAEVETLAGRDAELARVLPEVGPEVARLARWLREPAFAPVAAAVVRRVLDELAGPRRLHPDDPDAEIMTLRALARFLILSPAVVAGEEVEATFVARSRRLVAADFVEKYLERAGRGASAEAAALVRLAENVVGRVNKRGVGEWLKASTGALRFEREVRAGPEAALQKLAQLAELNHDIARIGLEEDQQAALALRLGEVAGQVEQDGHVISAIARAPGPPVGRLLALVRLANGEGAPPGPVTRRARTEALKLARDPEVRLGLQGASSGEVKRLGELLHTLSLTA